MAKVFRMLQLALQHEKRGEGFKIVDGKVLESPECRQDNTGVQASDIDYTSKESIQDAPGEEPSIDNRNSIRTFNF